ncbi:secretory calcium-binding phosphoprotein 9 [Amia ocellicauda]|uniref:secretory calcium-binding phosphoprotein 9 n=1 Tax=Amia ocellicauda TaxID=2972642 RepID=UPI003464E49E
MKLALFLVFFCGSAAISHVAAAKITLLTPLGNGLNPGLLNGAGLAGQPQLLQKVKLVAGLNPGLLGGGLNPALLGGGLNPALLGGGLNPDLLNGAGLIAQPQILQKVKLVAGLNPGLLGGGLNPGLLGGGLNQGQFGGGLNPVYLNGAGLIAQPQILQGLPYIILPPQANAAAAQPWANNLPQPAMATQANTGNVNQPQVAATQTPQIPLTRYKRFIPGMGPQVWSGAANQMQPSAPQPTATAGQRGDYPSTPASNAVNQPNQI